MMNGQEVISLYEAVAAITDQMLAAARCADWDQLAALEATVASHVQRLKDSEPPAALTGNLRAKKIKAIQKILADDHEIRSLTEPWMAQLSALINSSGAERKLHQLYGASQSG
jgi:flagellar protein FliT